MGDAKPVERKVVHLGGTRLSPECVLARTLEKAPRIKGVIVAIQWDDDSWSYDWSQMPLRDIAFGTLVWQEKFAHEAIPAATRDDYSVMGRVQFTPSSDPDPDEPIGD